MIGRVKAAIVTDDGTRPIGIVSEIIICSSANQTTDRIVLRGPGSLGKSTKKHLESIVLPIIDQITDNLKVPLKSYEISIVNLGATASADVGIEISGFSADLSMFIAFLSAALQLKNRQDVLCTGHIASIAGDLAPVRHIPAKLAAAVSTPSISTFLMPDLKKDRSLQVLTPREFEAAEKSIHEHKGDIDIRYINDVYDLAKLCFTEESMLAFG